jgi:hypothetical protein
MNSDSEKINLAVSMTAWQIIRWWEYRRIYYNALLAVTGILAIIGFEFVMDKAIPLGEDAIEPMALFIGVSLYAIVANLCYTLGWITELILRRYDPQLARKSAPRMFRFGLWFSCALTTLPFWYSCVFWVFFRSHPR